ncbi:MAG: hypothetical protein ABI598_04155 [Chloroflexota bacterium]
MADLFEMPTSRDGGLILTNLRTLDGRRPTFADQSGSTFFFPYQHIRFVEVPSDRAGAADGDPADDAPAPVAPRAGGEDDDIDEDFLRRIREA